MASGHGLKVLEPFRKSLSPERLASIKAAREEAREIKDSGFALGKAPERLTQKQQLRLEMIQANDPQLYRSYRPREALRLILKTSDAARAESDLKGWLWWAGHSGTPAFKEPCKKIRRRKQHILNMIRLGLGDARIEATNNEIRPIIRKAYGFRNIQNMMDMVYLACSKIRIPLPNRKSIQPKAA